MASGEEEVEGRDDDVQSSELNADGIRQFAKPDRRTVVDEESCGDQTGHDNRQTRYFLVDTLLF